MALFDQNRFRAFVSAFMLSAVLAGCGGGGGAPAPNPTFTSGIQSPTQIRNHISAGSGRDVVDIAGDTVSDIGNGETGLAFRGILDGLGGDEDEVRLVSDGRVASIAFSSNAPTGGELHLQRYEIITITGGRVDGLIDASGETTAGVTFNLRSGRVGPMDSAADFVAITGSSQNDVFIIAGDITGDSPALAINGLIQGGAGDQDEVRLVAGGRVGELNFSLAGASQLNLRDVEVITIDGGSVFSNVNLGTAPASITFNLRSGTINSSLEPDGGVGGTSQNDTFNLRGTITINGLINGNDGADIFNLESGTITGDVNGGAGADVFNLYSAIAIGGFLDGGAGTDVLNYAGATGTDFTARGGLADEDDIRDGDGSVRNIESQEDVSTITSIGAGAGGAPAGAGLRGLTVSGIEVLGLSPALNLYGAMSDALMQFGQQTAQGFALADLNLATGRATSLVSKDSPFTKGRIWAHKITHSGNGKGSIGLGLTGLTARADSDYDYEMSLTQHGFDAPLATTRLGAFNLRAVSHTMTGTIETNVAEANVSGYGAGLAMMWNNETLSAHITSLAGAYEVEAHTSPLNPRAVVNEITEGSFSAINAVVSAGVADTRKLGHSLVLRTTADLVWQTLSLDDFNETGADGIAINFDKATRFTARVGAGLESEHWFSDVVFVHETSSGGTLSSGLSQDYKQDDGTAIEMKFGGKIADLATGLTLKAYAGIRKSLDRSATIEPSARFDLSWRF